MPYYLHQGLTTGADNGTSKENAYKDVVTMLQNLPSGETCLAHQGESGKILSATITQVPAGGNITIIGVDSEFANDAPFTIDANNTANNIFNWNVGNRNTWRNFVFKRAVGAGLTGTSLGLLGLIDCTIELCGGAAFSGGLNTAGENLFKRLLVRNNTGYAFSGSSIRNVVIEDSLILANGGGFSDLGSSVRILNTHILKNGAAGLSLTANSSDLLIKNSTVDGNTASGISINGGANIVADDCRITNNGTYGIATNNTTSRIKLLDTVVSGNLTADIQLGGANSLLFDLGGNEIGGSSHLNYTDRDNNDYSVKAPDTRRRKKIYFTGLINPICQTAGAQGADVEERDFYLDKSVVSVNAGTVITVTLKYLAATLMTGLTLKGVACTDRTVTGANTLTFVTPDLTAGIGNIEGIITGYDNFVIYNGITAQAGASAPGAPTLTGYATGKYANLSWTMAATSVTYDIEIDGVVYTGYTSLSAEIAMPRANTEYSFRVRGVNTTGNGAWSTAITVKTEVVADDETIALAGTAVLSSVKDLTGTLHIAQGMTGAKIFDPIILPSAISQETFEYYVKDVLYNQGRNVL